MNLIEKINHLRKNNLHKTIYFLTVATAFIGSAFFAVDLGMFTLFPFRIMIIFLWGSFGAVLLTNKISFKQIKIKKELLFFVVWIIYALISLLWAEAKFIGLKDCIFIFINSSFIWLGVIYIEDFKDVNKLYIIWIGMTVFLSFIGLWESSFAQHLPVSKYFNESRGYWNFPTGVYRNPNNFASFLSLSFPFVLGLIRYGKDNLNKIFACGFSAIIILLIIKTGSRGNYLALLLEFIFIFLLFTAEKTKFKGLVVGVVFLLVLSLTPLGVDLFNKAQGKFQALKKKYEKEYGSIYIRTNLTRNSLVFFKNSKGLGVGAGNAKYYMKNHAVFDTKGISDVHNWWLEILTNYGIFIFVGYVVIYLSLIWRLYKIYQTTDLSNREKVIFQGTIIALVGFSIGSISPSSVLGFKPQWLLFALGFILLNIYKQEDNVSENN